MSGVMPLQTSTIQYFDTKSEDFEVATTCKTKNNNGDHNDYAIARTMTMDEIGLYEQTHGAKRVIDLEKRIEKRRLEVEKASAAFRSRSREVIPQDSQGQDN